MGLPGYLLGMHCPAHVLLVRFDLSCNVGKVARADRSLDHQPRTASRSASGCACVSTMRMLRVPPMPTTLR